MVLVSVMRRTVLSAFAVLASLAVSARMVSAQGGGQQQQAPQNLKFFPKDTPRDSLLPIMRSFTYALGVNCSFCHVEEPASQPGGRPQLRPERDDKTEKQTARFML